MHHHTTRPPRAMALIAGLPGDGDGVDKLAHYVDAIETLYAALKASLGAEEDLVGVSDDIIDGTTVILVTVLQDSRLSVPSRWRGYRVLTQNSRLSVPSRWRGYRVLTEEDTPNLGGVVTGPMQSMILDVPPDNSRDPRKGIGYWRPIPAEAYNPLPSSLYGPCGYSARDEVEDRARHAARNALPDPHDYVDDHWDPDEAEMVARYLDRGKEVSAYRGMSYCRICGKHNGSRSLGDKAYIWPQGFSHYVRAHSVRPPPEFIEHVRRGGPALVDHHKRVDRAEVRRVERVKRKLTRALSGEPGVVTIGTGRDRLVGGAPGPLTVVVYVTREFNVALLPATIDGVTVDVKPSGMPRAY